MTHIVLYEQTQLTKKERNSMAELFPSLISSQLLYLGNVITLLEPHCAGFHIDIMDFHFVPNLTWGPPFINAIAQQTEKPLQLHLMVDQPQRYFDCMTLRAGDTVIVHYEAMEPATLLEAFIAIKKRGWLPSIAINPSTPVSTIIQFLPYVQHVLLMSVNPGFSGQPFIPATIHRLKELIEIRLHHKASFTICLDGGITSDNFCTLQALGMDQAAIASAIFTTPDIVTTIKQLKTCT